MLCLSGFELYSRWVPLIWIHVDGYLSYLWKLAVRPKCRTVSEKLPFTNSSFYNKKNMGSCADGTENFGRLVSVPKKLLLLFPEKEPFP